jgi:hypothetical protein
MAKVIMIKEQYIIIPDGIKHGKMKIEFSGTMAECQKFIESKTAK